MIKVESNEEALKEYVYQERIKKMKIKWKRIILDGEKSDYSISNTGLIKNRITKKIQDFKNSSSRYIQVELKYNNKKYRYLVHRLVAIAFHKVPKVLLEAGYTIDDLYVNHKDGMKHHNAAFNLEWTTPKGNSDHAWNEGLCDGIRGENNHLAKITEETAKEIIKLIMDRKNNKEIAELLKDKGVTESTVQHIRSKECWKHLTANIEFPKLAEDKKFTISLETIHNICKVLEEKKYSDSVIAKMFGVKREYVKDIRTRRRRKDISKDYNF